jgi:hypothetical protein
MVIIYFFLLKVQSRIDLGMFECRERFYATSGVTFCFFHFSAIFLNKKNKKFRMELDFREILL